jgi:hypothetical protein
MVSFPPRKEQAKSSIYSTIRRFGRISLASGCHSSHLAQELYSPVNADIQTCTKINSAADTSTVWKTASASELFERSSPSGTGNLRADGGIAGLIQGHGRTREKSSGTSPTPSVDSWTALYGSNGAPNAGFACHPLLAEHSEGGGNLDFSGR